MEKRRTAKWGSTRRKGGVDEREKDEDNEKMYVPMKHRRTCPLMRYVV